MIFLCVIFIKLKSDTVDMNGVIYFVTICEIGCPNASEYILRLLQHGFSRGNGLQVLYFSSQEYRPIYLLPFSSKGPLISCINSSVLRFFWLLWKCLRQHDYSFKFVGTFSTPIIIHLWRMGGASYRLRLTSCDCQVWVFITFRGPSIGSKWILTPSLDRC